MRRAGRWFLAVALVGGAAVLRAAPAPDVQQRWEAGNAAYEKGDWDKSLESYLSLVRQGFSGTALCYNLGNVYFKRGERGRSILWYERAHRLDPRDPDIAFNLSLARSQIKNAEPSFGERIATYFTANELGWTMLALNLVFFGFLGAMLLGWVRPDVWLSTVLWFFGLTGLLVAAWFGVATWLESEPAAIVISPPGEVRNGPGNEYAVGFTIPEGSRVVVMNERPDWVQVGVPQEGLKGWMPTAEVERITGRAWSS